MTPDLRTQLALYNKSQEQFARDVGVSVHSVSRWIRGHRNPSPLALKRIKEVLEAYEEEKQDQDQDAAQPITAD